MDENIVTLQESPYGTCSSSLTFDLQIDERLRKTAPSPPFEVTLDIFWWLAASGLALALAAFVQSGTGFGFALISTPVLLLGLEPHATVAVVLILHSIQCGLVVADERTLIDTRRLAPLVVGGSIGTPLGVLVLRSLNGPGLSLVIGALVVISGAFLLAVRPHPLPRERTGAVVAGLISGVLNGGSGIGGPPIAIYASNQAWPRAQFRVALMTTFLASNIVALALFVPLSLVQDTAVGAATVLAPAVVVGWAVHRVRGRRLALLGETSFRKLIGALVVVAGVAILLRS